MIKDKYQNSFNFKFELVITDQVIKLLKLLRLQKKKLQNL